MVDLLIQYLNCPCQVFKPASHDDALMNAYCDAAARGKKEGFFPVLVVPDETLMECLLGNSDEEMNQQSGWSFSPSQVAAYRERMLRTFLPDGNEYLNRLKGPQGEFTSKETLDLKEIMGEMTGGESLNDFSGYWSFCSKKTETVVLAEIPVKNPWEVFVWLPFGGWNECPCTEELMAAAKYWYESYEAVPAVISHDVLEFSLPAPVKTQEAMDLALEQVFFCPDIMDQGPEDGTIGMLADTLSQSVVWYFWWD